MTGRRPPIAAAPIVSGAMWVVVGIAVLIWFSAAWTYVVGIVCIGVGLLFIRGGLVAYRRQGRRRSR